MSLLTSRYAINDFKVCHSQVQGMPLSTSKYVIIESSFLSCIFSKNKRSVTFAFYKDIKLGKCSKIKNIVVFFY